LLQRRFLDVDTHNELSFFFRLGLLNEKFVRSCAEHYA
jgi:hypothetical protein